MWRARIRVSGWVETRNHDERININAVYSVHNTHTHLSKCVTFQFNVSLSFSIILFFLYFESSAYEFPVIRIANKNEWRKKVCARQLSTHSMSSTVSGVRVANCQILIDLCVRAERAARRGSTADIRQTFIVHHIGACWLHYVFVLCV